MMKPSLLKTTLLFLSLTLYIACSDDDEIQSETIEMETEMDVESPEETTSLIELEFSTPPIDLQDLDVQFAQDIPYDQYESTRFDIFLPNSDTPTALVVFIHGGGFTGGDKGFIYNESFPQEILELLSDQVAVATINYRLIESNDTEGVLKSLNDSKRAIQYMRYIHNELNIDKENIVLFGSSAGASTALWLASNDDLRETTSTDPVLQESTRVKGIALRATQSSLNIEERWLNDVFGEFDVTLDNLIDAFGEATIFNFYGISSWEEYHTPEIDAYRQQVDMLALLSADDPEIWVTNTGGHNNIPQTTSSWNHHPFHAREIKEFADAVGVTNVATYGNPIVFSDPSEETYIDFLLRKINE